MSNTNNRSAVNGRFVTERYAKSHPNTTVQERRSPSPKPASPPAPKRGK